MSFKLVKQIIDSDKVEGMHKLVLIILANFVNEDRDTGAWPAVSTIALKAGSSPRHTRRLIRELENDGFIETKIRAGMKGTNRYHIYPQGRTFETLSAPDERTFEKPRADMGVLSSQRTFETPRADMGVLQTDKEHIGTYKAPSVAAAPPAGGALGGDNWQFRPADELPCNHTPTIMVPDCPECWTLMKQGKWEPDTLTAR